MVTFCLFAIVDEKFGSIKKFGSMFSVHTTWMEK